MNDRLDRLYDLLPAVYRLRDAEKGWPLRGLLQVMAEQANVLEKDIAQLYENWFIETCQDWVVPYIGDLVGYRPAHLPGEAGSTDPSEERLRERILIPRRDVANMIRFRRRKGTLALLSELAETVAEWPARAVEFYKLLGVAQAINFLRVRRGRTADLRDGDALDLLDGPFDEIAHTVDVRRVVSRYGPGRYNIPSVGVFVWRLKSYSVGREAAAEVPHTPAYCYEAAGDHCYLFSALGNDTPLFTRPERQETPEHQPGLLNLPEPIRRRAFAATGADIEAGEEPGKTGYYGLEKSFVIWAPDWPKAGAPQPLPAELIVPANLSDWKYRHLVGRVAVDPELGRIVFPPRQLPKAGVWVSYQYGFSADIGGGEYERPISQPKDYKLYRVGPGETYTRITDAITQWEWDQPPSAVIEITDSGVYTEQVRISLKDKRYLQLRAANKKRPILRLLDMLTSLPDSMQVHGEAGCWFVLDGLLITGRGIRIEGELSGAMIRHSTLVPGWGLHCNCEPHHPTEASLEIADSPGCVTIEHSIVGAIVVIRDEAATDPVLLRLSDTILDATDSDALALSDPESCAAYAALTIVRCTVLGALQVHAIELGENCIFDGLVTVERRQSGCLRFCYVPPHSETPRRYECQPDLVEGIARDVVLAGNSAATPTEIAAAQETEDLRVQPQFNSTRYGTPTYCQLADACAEEIRRGADDESEMGVFHDLFQPQREDNLRVRLEEFTPAAMDAGIIHAT